jgi:hypothetical protein
VVLLPQGTLRDHGCGSSVTPASQVPGQVQTPVPQIKGLLRKPSEKPPLGLGLQRGGGPSVFTPPDHGLRAGSLQELQGWCVKA